MKKLSHGLSYLFFLILLVGCASSHVASRQEYKGAKIARPEHILVYDFAATSADVPTDSAMAGQYAEFSSPQTAQQVSAGQQAGAEIAQILTGEIRKMGLPAEQATALSKPQIGDLVIRGYILSVDQGDAAKRVAIGFGSGASHLQTAVEGFLMTDKGLKKLGSGTEDAGGSKSPGTAVALAGAVATANPAGLIISTAMKVHGEASGSSNASTGRTSPALALASLSAATHNPMPWTSSIRTSGTKAGKA
ncbi:MAG: DUF4410 domain-containing protein, partial [Candidatus Methylumidiphilus sp.]